MNNNILYQAQNNPTGFISVYKYCLGVLSGANDEYRNQEKILGYFNAFNK